MLLEDGTEVIGCNQENAAYPVTICAERSALFSAGAQYPELAVTTIAIAARNENGELLAEPITPCGSCRQALIETETRYGRPHKDSFYTEHAIYTLSKESEISCHFHSRTSRCRFKPEQMLAYLICTICTGNSQDPVFRHVPHRHGRWDMPL